MLAVLGLATPASRRSGVQSLLGELSRGIRCSFESGSVKFTLAPHLRLCSVQADKAATTEQSAPRPCWTTHLSSFAALAVQFASDCPCHLTSSLAASSVSSGWCSSLNATPEVNCLRVGSSHSCAATPLILPPLCVISLSSPSSVINALPTFPPRLSIRFFTFSARSSTSRHFRLICAFSDSGTDDEESR